MEAHVTTTAHLEREAKLEAEPDFVLPECVPLGADVSAGAPHEQGLDTTYYDTPDFRLVGHAASLRFRAGEGWTVKLPVGARGQTLIRAEHTFAGPSDTPPQEARDLVRAVVRREPLVPVVQLRTLRRRVPLLDLDRCVLGEIVDDKVTVLKGGSPAAEFQEVEVELADHAPDELLDVIVGALLRRGARAGPVRSKLVRALDLLGEGFHKSGSGSATQPVSPPAV